MKKLLLIFLLFACSKEEIKKQDPQSIELSTKSKSSSARLLDECEDITASNGIILDECDIKLGGQFTEHTYMDGNGKEFWITDLQGATFTASGAPGSSGLYVNQSGVALTHEKSSENKYTIFRANTEDPNGPYMMFNVSSETYGSSVELGANGLQIVSTNGFVIYAANDQEILRINPDGKISITVPNSPTGLNSGMMYTDNGFYKKVP